MNHMHQGRGLDGTRDRAIGLLPVSNVNGPQRCGKGTLGPVEVAKLGADADGRATGFDGVDSEHMPAQPGGWPGGPSVAKALG